jgi:hypothetical protein
MREALAFVSLQEALFLGKAAGLGLLPLHERSELGGNYCKLLKDTL